MEERQLINLARPTASTTSSKAHCTAFTLPSNGILELGLSSVLTLTSDAVFKPECTGTSGSIVTNTDSTTFNNLRDPFYASTIPECYALAATTVIAYMLVIMLLITPRTFLHEGAVVLGRRGFTNGPSGSDAGIGIGGRPWLQKVAAMTVAVSLTIATADTFKVAEYQYENGFMNARALQDKVEDGMELKIVRVISDTFLWLAQAQTLIRLFPRQREKIIIKWTAFALITLDVLFSILNNFVYNGTSRPRSFVDAVPALAYLFQLALSLLYAAWVIYYSVTKKRFAFYHPQMRNICLVALLSLVAVLVPVVFFVLDISKPDLAGWGDYVRWVGAAAASVVVWEWVERIEALERDDKKDGVLGREVFDEDEMLEVSASVDSNWSSRLTNRKEEAKGKGGSGGGGGITTGSNGIHWPGVVGITSRYRPRATQDMEAGAAGDNTPAERTTRRIPRPRPPLWPTRPPVAATPVSRADTASAESTVYAIRYHPISEATPSIREDPGPPGLSRSNSLEITNAGDVQEYVNSEPDKSLTVEQVEEGHKEAHFKDRGNTWQAFAKVNPFKRIAQEPPPEVSAHTLKAPEAASSHAPSNRWDVRARLEDFAATQAEKFRDKKSPNANVGLLPVTIIPAPPRRRNLAATAIEEMENATGEDIPPPSNPSATRVATANNTLNKTPNTADAQSSKHPQSQRFSEPHVPDDLNAHSIYQHGGIAIATTVQQNQDRNRTLSLFSPVSPLEGPRDFTLFSTRSSPLQPRSPILPRRDGPPIVTIPAPPRRPRSNED